MSLSKQLMDDFLEQCYKDNLLILLIKNMPKDKHLLQSCRTELDKIKGSIHDIEILRRRANRVSEIETLLNTKLTLTPIKDLQIGQYYLASLGDLYIYYIIDNSDEKITRILVSDSRIHESHKGGKKELSYAMYHNTSQFFHIPSDKLHLN